jgi:ubiquinone/menaquinone biosynthesis C-methylase UbiE
MDELNLQVARQYDAFQTILELQEKAEKYLNYGYSETRSEPIEVKQAQLCRTVFEAANIEPGHVVVDVGFGSGEQDFLFTREYDFSRLYGYNIAQSQVGYAARRATQEGLSDKLIFRHGPSEDMTELEDQSVDRILSIECAFYFDRPRFYREAARVLRPGGILVLADICFSDHLKWLSGMSLDLRRVGTRSKNRSDWQDCFDTKSQRSINREVIPGSQETVRKLALNLARRFDFKYRRAWFEVLKMAVSTQICNLGFRSDLLHYDLIVLEKCQHTSN